jgi:hypothetical protein
MAWWWFGRKARTSPEDALRLAEWQAALTQNRLPAFVQTRLADASAGKTPWLSTMTPMELRLSRSHGIRPLATVSGTCWYHFGYSWTRGHAEGWHAALGRLKAEALACGANAVVDVAMRTTHGIAIGSSMDYTVIGTAVRIEGLPPSPDPVIATVPAFEFVRLLEMGVVPVGVAIGAHYEWLNPARNNLDKSVNLWTSAPLTELGQFWERIRRRALADLLRDTKAQGHGVLAHTHFGELRKVERDKQPPNYLGRHIVIGTVVHDRPSPLNKSHPVGIVVDMCAGPSPLSTPVPHGHNAYPVKEEGGLI